VRQQLQLQRLLQTGFLVDVVQHPSQRPDQIPRRQRYQTGLGLCLFRLRPEVGRRLHGQHHPQLGVEVGDAAQRPSQDQRFAH